jgi:hypothetical protein
MRLAPHERDAGVRNTVSQRAIATTWIVEAVAAQPEGGLGLDYLRTPVVPVVRMRRILGAVERSAGRSILSPVSAAPGQPAQAPDRWM